MTPEKLAIKYLEQIIRLCPEAVPMIIAKLNEYEENLKRGSSD